MTTAETGVDGQNQYHFEILHTVPEVISSAQISEKIIDIEEFRNFFVLKSEDG